MGTTGSELRGPRAWREFTPKLVTALSEGYGPRQLRADAVAGLTVAVVALPLAMALAIASGTTPDKGLITAVVAGFLISALGGSRFQIGGPTGAFVVVVFDVIARHGYEGLVLATFLAGLMLMVAGLARLGAAVKYIPEPVITGFTAGIGVIIASSQLKDFLGLEAAAPAEFVAKIGALWAARDTFDPVTAALAVGSLVAILALRRLAPRAPGFLLVVLATALAVWALKMPVDTIGSRFGGVPSGLPAPALPAFSFELLRDVAPSAFTIAFLAGLESLLSAVVADGMTGRKHRSNGELVAQGVANSASALFGGMPATGAIARTATNIRAGAATPVAGMLHAVFLLVFMLVAAPLASFVPLAALAAVLLVVAWNMAEPHKFRDMMKAPVEDRLLLVTTFALTVLVDLTFAIEVGVVMAALVFMHRMAQVAEVRSGEAGPAEDDEEDGPPESPEQRVGLPPGVEVFQFRGPLFFGAAGRLADAFEGVGLRPKVVILRMREVPLLDATAAGVLTTFLKRMHADGARVILSGLQPQPKKVLADLGLFDDRAAPELARDYAEAKAQAATAAASR